jgi:hypothetical protein
MLMKLAQVVFNVQMLLGKEDIPAVKPYSEPIHPEKRNPFTYWSLNKPANTKPVSGIYIINLLLLPPKLK